MNCFGGIVHCLLLVSAPASAPFLDLSLDQALEKAQEQGKSVLVHFHDPSKAQCQTYREITWANEEVQEWMNQHVIAIELDAGSNADLLRRFDVRLVPTVVVLAPAGATRATIVGFRDPKTLIGELNTKLRASDPVGLAKTWVEQNSGSPAALLLFARTLEEAGRVDEALDYYLRCFDNTSSMTAGFGGMQLVVLEELGRMSSKSAKAKDAIIQRRDASRQRLLAGHAQRNDPAVLVSANTWLHDFDDTLATFKKLSDEHPRSLMTRLLRESTVESARQLKQYDRIVELIDPAAYAQRAYDQYQGDLRRAVPEGASEADFRALTRSAYIRRTIQYYEMLIGSQRNAHAETIASMLLSIDDSPATWSGLASAGLRSGRPTIANAEQARRAIQEAGGKIDAQSVTTLVQISLLLGQRNEAQRVVEKYLPNITDARKRDFIRRLMQESATED